MIVSFLILTLLGTLHPMAPVTPKLSLLYPENHHVTKVRNLSMILEQASFLLHRKLDSLLSLLMGSVRLQISITFLLDAYRLVLTALHASFLPESPNLGLIMSTIQRHLWILFSGSSRPTR